MSDLIKATGKCLCGEVTLSTNSMVKNVGACHCSMCVTWNGGPFMAVGCKQDLKIEGEEFVARFSSSTWAERGFCKNCGTHLFYKLKETSEYHVPAGIFKKDDLLNFTHQLFIDEKPSYYNFSNETSKMTGAEVFEMFTSKE